MAGPHVRDACARHLRDLEDGPARGLRWDVAAVQRVVDYFQVVLRLNGGEHEGKPFVLEPWQAFVVGSLFGWKKQNGYRRFNFAFIETAKGSGKSPLAAGIGLYGLTADGEPRAEVYAAAAKMDQAKVLFRDAVAMVNQSPALASRLEISGGSGKEFNIAHIKSGSFFRPISSERQGKGQSGPRPHIALLDEIHEHPTSATVDFLSAGTKGRTQALVVGITNSGVDRLSVAYQHHEYGVKVAAGALVDDSYFAYVCAVDEGEDPLDPKTGRACWAKANPSLGITIKEEYLERQVREALGMPAKESIVRRLNFCQWVDAANPWIDGAVWRAVASAKFDRARLRERPCYGALDLSGTLDLTALAVFFPEWGGDPPHAWVEFWTPGDTLLERARKDRVPYDVWKKEGHVNAPKGRAVNYNVVAVRLGEIVAEYDLQGVAFDQYRIKYFEEAMAEEGVSVELVPHGQGFGRAAESHLWMPRSVEVLEGHIFGETVRIHANPALTWNASSAVIAQDAKGNRVFEKRLSTGRIDGVVALAMAAGYAESKPPAAKRSPYEDRGIRFF